MNPKFSYLIVLFIALFAISSAQNETKIWYFGNQAGLDFNTSPPTILTDGVMPPMEGCSSIADANGNLLFYSDGGSIYNQTHTVMANGCCLNGWGTSSQAVLIVKQPGNTNIYYVFTTEGMGGSNGFGYTIIDMNLAAGMGSVTVKNVQLFGPSSEKQAAVKHCNGNDVWIVSHEIGTNNFRAYLLTAAGLNPVPVISSIGISYTPGIGGYGNIKISPFGSRLAVTDSNLNTAELYEFNNSTGVVSNLINLGTLPKAYGCEFSPDGSKLYVPNFNAGTLHQWDICGNPDAIISSKQTVGSSPEKMAAIQLAPDGKIYVARRNQIQLGVIISPNLSGSTCNYQDTWQSTAPKVSEDGLPSFVSSFFSLPLSVPLPFTYNHSTAISCSKVAFNIPLNVNTSCSAKNGFAENILWEFGDPISGAANVSTLTNPVHHYYTAGIYTVMLTFDRACKRDTLIQQITIAESSPKLVLQGKSTICSGESTILNATGAISYTWQSAINAQTLQVSPQTTSSFTVSGSHALNSCIDVAVFTVSVAICDALTQNVTHKNNFRIYPNPFCDFINVFSENNQTELYICNIINVMGEIVLTTKLQKNQERIKLDNLTPGIYFVEIANSHKKEMYKIIKE